MADTSIKIKADQASAKAAGEATGKSFSEGATTGAKKAADNTVKAYDKASKDIKARLDKAIAQAAANAEKLLSKSLGADKFKSLGPDFSAKFAKGLEGAANDAKVKDAWKKLSDKTASDLSRKLGFKVTADAVQKVAQGAASPEQAQQGPSKWDRVKAGLGVGAGISMAALGGLLSGMVTAFKGEHQTAMGMAPYTGVGGAFRGLGTGRGMEFTRAETVGALAPAHKMGVGLDRDVLRATRLGIGSEATEWMGEQVTRGARLDSKTVGGAVPEVSIKDFKQEARTNFQKILGVGVATGLERGRMGELFRGMTQMMSTRGLGQGISQEAVSAALLRAGQAGLRGDQGFRAAQGAERFMQSKSGLSRVAALGAVGFGKEQGLGYYTAQRKIESGLYGEEYGKKLSAEESQHRMQSIVETFKQPFGVKGKLSERSSDPIEEEKRNTALAQAVSEGIAPTIAEVEKYFAIMEKDKITEEDQKKLKTMGMSAEDKMYSELTGLSKQAQGIALDIEKIFTHLSRLLEGPINRIEGYLGMIAGWVQTLNTKNPFGKSDWKGDLPPVAKQANDMLESLNKIYGMSQSDRQNLAKRGAGQFQKAVSSTTGDIQEYAKRQESIRQFVEETGVVPEASEKGIKQLQEFFGNQGQGSRVSGMKEFEIRDFLEKYGNLLKEPAVIQKEAAEKQLETARINERNQKSTAVAGSARGAPTNDPSAVLNLADRASGHAVGGRP